MYEIADKPKVCKHWRSYQDGSWMQVFHYSTLMLAWHIGERGKWDGNVDTVYYSTGHGSVSDQNGMNNLFARLGMPFYFSRAGGARISELDAPLYKYGVTPGSSRLVKRNGKYERVTV